MQLFDQSLADMIRKKWITLEDGLNYCEDPDALRRLVKGKISSGDDRGLIGG
jgi:Tfp pilus assembly ATPase PilU